MLIPNVAEMMVKKSNMGAVNWKSLEYVPLGKLTNSTKVSTRTKNLERSWHQC